MEPNQSPTPVEKKEETNPTTPIVNPAKQEQKVQPVQPAAADNKKIGDLPDTKESKDETVKAETPEAEPVEKKN